MLAPRLHGAVLRTHHEQVRLPRRAHTVAAGANDGGAAGGKPQGELNARAIRGKGNRARIFPMNPVGVKQKVARTRADKFVEREPRESLRLGVDPNDAAVTVEDEHGIGGERHERGENAGNCLAANAADLCERLLV